MQPALASKSPASLAGGRILVCLDRTVAGEVCVPYAVQLAKTFGGRLTLLHVMSEAPAAGAMAQPLPHDVFGWELKRQEARGYLERWQATIAGALGDHVDIVLEQGVPAQRIADVARERAAAMTIVAGRSDLPTTAWRPGGTLQRLLGALPNSLLVVQATPATPARQPPTTRRIMVPLDGSLGTEHVLPLAARMAKAYGAELLLTHVVREAVRAPLLLTEADMAMAAALADRMEVGAAQYLLVLQQRLARDGAQARAMVVRHGHEARGLLEVARQQEVDLIVISAHGAGGEAERSFGGVAAYLLAAPCVPVLVLQAPSRHVGSRVALPSSAALKGSWTAEHI